MYCYLVFERELFVSVVATIPVHTLTWLVGHPVTPLQCICLSARVLLSIQESEVPELHTPRCTIVSNYTYAILLECAPISLL